MSLRIAIVTAGGAGMFCGSCMHDNTWARALREAGDDVWLIPTYTPLTLDEADQSERTIFLGGINVYLEHRSRLWRRLPRGLTRWLDAPAVIRAATSFGVSNDASQLGDLTLEMLRGAHGPQKREIDLLVDHLVGDCRPDAILFSNMLLSGIAEPLRGAFDGPIWGVLQGDDIFLNALLPDYRQQAIDQITSNSQAFTGLITHSDFYADTMSNMLSIPRDRFRRAPLGISFAGHDGTPGENENDAFTIGYFARLCPEKGLHELIRAFRILHEHHPAARLVIGGYLGKRDVAYWRRIERENRDIAEAFHYAGSPATLAEKISLIRRFDLLSVPTTYEEPKGLYVLEALANGVPVVQPAHGAFPEMIAATGGGLLFPPGDAESHAAALTRLMDRDHRMALAHKGYAAVREHYSEDALVKATREILSDGSEAPGSA